MNGEQEQRAPQWRLQSHPRAVAFGVLGAGLLALLGTPQAWGADTPDSATYFEQHIRPILASNCVKCHGADRQKSDLRLDSREAMLLGGSEGASVVPGDLQASLLIRAIRREGGLEMPPDVPLAESEIKHLEAWVAAGAPWPEHAEPVRESTGEITDADRNWWAFQPLAQPALPELEDDAWSSNAIDRFVHQRHRERGIEPAPPAGPATLVRRVYYDLLGMPPTPEEIEQFVRDTAPDAWEKLVDRLLADPRYGEHWARFWLDLVRYAESDGWNQDKYRPQIWRYRDYVVNAFNSDKPYTDFVREQLAGDEITGDSPEDITATGYLRLGIYEYNQRNAAGHWNDIMNEITDVTGNVFFGLSMACSRCHDHKFDPIPQTDYFSLRAFFEPIVWKDDVPAATDAERAAWREQQSAWEMAAADVRAEIEALIQPYYEKHAAKVSDMFPLDIQACYQKPAEARSSWEQQMAYLVERQCIEEAGGPLRGLSEEDKARHKALEEALKAFDEVKPEPLPLVMAAADHTGPLSPTIMPGDAAQTPIEPQFLTVLASNPLGREPVLPEATRSSGRRSALAGWIGHPENPLTTRVIVNRIWQQHFGEGIVPSASDFGHLGQPPTHPELLDWLTGAFIADGWRFKPLHKQILMSSTWRQSAEHPRAAENQAKDPEEVLLWRARVRRLNAEELRDSMLAASGEFDPRIGGPSVDDKAPRRGLYVKRMRNTPDALLAAFDTADGLTSTSQRNTTTTPTQALMLINGAYTLDRAAKFAERIRGVEFENREAALDFAFRTVWGRSPTDAELDRALDYLGTAPEGEAPGLDPEKLTDLCHVLLNSNAFMYVD